MTCTNCGAELKENAKFCAKCGTKVEEAPLIQVCGTCRTPLKEGAKFCAKCGASAGGALSVSAPPSKKAAEAAGHAALNMIPMTSEVNPWEYDVPAFFEDLDMTFTDTENTTQMLRQDPTYVFCVSRGFLGAVPAGSSGKKLESLSDWIEFYMNAWGNPAVLVKKETAIHEIPAVYYNLNYGNELYMKAAFMEKDDFLYVIYIWVPYAEKSAREEEMNAFINSVEINYAKGAAGNTAPRMKHKTSEVNPWEYEFPAVFEDLAMTFADTENNTSMVKENPAYCFALVRGFLGAKPAGLFAKKLDSLSSWIEYFMNAWANPTVLRKKETTIHGIPAVYYNVNYGGHSYMKAAFMEKEGFLYEVHIQVPYAEKLKHEEEMSAFINSVKIKYATEAAGNTAPRMIHKSSGVNPWEYDIPAFFQTLEMTSADTENATQMVRENPAYGVILQRALAGTKPGLFAKKLDTLSDLIGHQMNAWGNPTVLGKGDIAIHGIPAVYYNVNYGGHSYLKAAFMEKEGFFYEVHIQVPYAEKLKHEKEMTAFINSVTVKDVAVKQEEAPRTEEVQRKAAPPSAPKGPPPLPVATPSVPKEPPPLPTASSSAPKGPPPLPTATPSAPKGPPPLPNRETQ